MFNKCKKEVLAAKIKKVKDMLALSAKNMKVKKNFKEDSENDQKW